MLHQMNHSHAHGYRPLESYWFADEILKGNRIPQARAEYADGKVEYYCDAKIKSVRLFYITSEMTYILREKYKITRTFMAQEWHITDLDPEKSFAELPRDAVGKYIEFTIENGIVLTTPYME